MLTNKISATIAQFIFKANSPKNTKTYAAMVFLETIIMAAAINGTLIKSPKAHNNGSAVGKRLTNVCERYDPKGTPIMPATIVRAPNLNETLFDVEIFF